MMFVEVRVPIVRIVDLINPNKCTQVEVAYSAPNLIIPALFNPRYLAKAYLYRRYRQ
jgi:hypothetical protein